MQNQKAVKYWKFTYPTEGDAIKARDKFHKVHPNGVAKLQKTAIGTHLFVQRKLGFDRGVIEGIIR